MDQAGELVPFEPVQPARLGPPDGVEVTADGRLLAMTWGDGTETVRLDQFDGRPSPLFVKTATLGEEATLVALGDTDAWWFAEPHDLELLDDGDVPPQSIRVAGPTLVWVADGVTLRLEGLEREHAVAIARSTLGTG